MKFSVTISGDVDFGGRQVTGGPSHQVAADGVGATSAVSSIKAGQLTGELPLVETKAGSGEYRWFGPDVFERLPTGEQLDEAVAVQLGDLLGDFLITDDLVVEVLVRSPAMGVLAAYLLQVAGNFGGPGGVAHRLQELELEGDPCYSDDIEAAASCPKHGRAGVAV